MRNWFGVTTRYFCLFLAGGGLKLSRSERRKQRWELSEHMYLLTYSLTLTPNVVIFHYLLIYSGAFCSDLRYCSNVYGRMRRRCEFSHTAALWVAEITIMPQFLLRRKCKSFPFGQDVALGSRGGWASLLGSTARSYSSAPAGRARRPLVAL